LSQAITNNVNTNNNPYICLLDNVNNVTLFPRIGGCPEDSIPYAPWPIYVGNILREAGSDYGTFWYYRIPDFGLLEADLENCMHTPYDNIYVFEKLQSYDFFTHFLELATKVVAATALKLAMTEAPLKGSINRVEVPGISTETDGEIFV